MQGVPFFFKQWGGVRKAKNGRLLDGRTYDEYPERVVGQVPDRVSCTKSAAEFLESFRMGLNGQLVSSPHRPRSNLPQRLKPVLRMSYRSGEPLRHPKTKAQRFITDMSNTNRESRGDVGLIRLGQ